MSESKLQIVADLAKIVIVTSALFVLIEWAFRPATADIPLAQDRFSVSSEAGKFQIIRDGVSGTCWGTFTNRHLSVATFGPIPCE